MKNIKKRIFAGVSTLFLGISVSSAAPSAPNTPHLLEFVQFFENLIQDFAPWDFSNDFTTEFAAHTSAQTGKWIVKKARALYDESAQLVAKTKAGKIGFGTGFSSADPAYTVDVDGDVNFTGGLFKNGVPFTSGAEKIDDLSDAKYFADRSLFLGLESGASYGETSGVDNVGVGTSTLFQLQNGTNNVAVGNASMVSLSAGSGNTALGNAALISLISGDGNIALGEYALGDQQSGDANVAIGVNTGTFGSASDLHRGSKNIYIGDNATAKFPETDEEIVIGANTTGAGSHSVTLGSLSNEKTLLRGKVGVDNDSPTFNLDVTGDINFTGDLYKNGSLLAFGGGGLSAPPTCVGTNKALQWNGNNWLCASISTGGGSTPPPPPPPTGGAVNGSCGSNAGVGTLAGGSNWCSSGTLANFSDNGDGQRWSCIGAYGGVSPDCSRNVAPHITASFRGLGGFLRPIQNGGTSPTPNIKVEISGVSPQSEVCTYTDGASNGNCLRLGQTGIYSPPSGSPTGNIGGSWYMDFTLERGRRYRMTVTNPNGLSDTATVRIAN